MARYFVQQPLCGSGGDKPRLHPNWALSRFLRTQKCVPIGYADRPTSHSGERCRQD